MHLLNHENSLLTLFVNNRLSALLWQDLLSCSGSGARSVCAEDWPLR